MATSSLSRRTRRQGMRALLVSLLALGAYGAWAAPSPVAFIGYGLIVLAAFLPAYLWLARGAVGIPVLAAFALVHIPYFALPIVRGGAALSMYDEDEILVAAASVAAFLLCAAAASFLGRTVPKRAPVNDDPAVNSHLHFLITGGLVVGALFQVGSATGWIWWLDTFYGAVRSVSITFCLVACYCLGVAMGQQLLSRRKLQLGLVLLAGNAVLSWSSLFLVGGMMFILACLLGYVVSSGKVPWKSFVLIFAVVSVLQAGKRDMRDEFWYEGTNYGSPADIVQLPSLMSEWAIRGLDVLSRHDDPTLEGDVARQGVLERTSLLPILLLAQRMTPDVVDYLGGETYTLLPQILLPRFIAPDKPTSQEGMNLLNISYGVLLEHEADRTAVGWGLVSEAYANFGYFGIIGMGLVIGFFCRLITSRSAGRSPASLPVLLSIAVLLNLLNMEADFTGLSLTLLQSAIAVLIFSAVLTIIARRATKRARAARGYALVVRK